MVALFNNIATLLAALPQTQTNGDSKLGTSDAPQLGDYMGNWGGAVPWGDRTVGNSNQYKDTPNTGEIKLPVIPKLGVEVTTDECPVNLQDN
jgi:hypothetical protein